MKDRPQRTKEQQEYRDNLAWRLKNFGKYGKTGSRLRRLFLEKEKEGWEYKKLVLGEDVNKDKKFEGVKLDKNKAYEMIRNGEWRSVLDNIDKFGGLMDDNMLQDWEKTEKDWDNINEKITKEGGPSKVIFDRSVARRYKDASERDFWNLLRSIGLKLDSETAYKMFKNRDGRYVIDNLDIFERHSHKEILEKYIQYLEEYTKTLPYGDRGETFFQPYRRELECFKENKDKFEGKKLGRDMALELLYRDRYFRIDPELFEINYKEFVDILIKSGRGDSIEEFLEKLSDNNKEFAKTLIDHGAARVVARNLEKFEGLDEEIATMIIEAGYGECVAENPEKFGLKNEDNKQ